MWLFVPVQGALKEFLATLDDYPLQQGSSLSAAGILLQPYQDSGRAAKAADLGEAWRSDGAFGGTP